MKVILLKDVRNVGRKDEVKDVAEGFATNFLFRQSLAIAASAERIAALEKSKAEQEARAAAADEALDGLVRSLSHARVEMRVRATPKGGLFKAVTVADIARAIQEARSASIPENLIQLRAPIKTIDEYAIELRSNNAKSEITLAILPAE